jgi:hypothetical protein
MESYNIKITEEIAEAAVLGGLFLGGGGGGSSKEGMRAAEEALKLGELTLVSYDHVNRDDIVITASAVGSPASIEKFISAEQCKKAYEMYRDLLDGEIGGIITNENGGHSTTNGWIVSAMTGIPLIDAPCNGRAHPTASMGSMGLSQIKGYKTIQIAIGGNPDLGKEIEVIAKGSLNATSSVVRHAAVEAGGLVTVLRNPVKAEYLENNAAIGGLKQAIDIGKVFLKHKKDMEAVLKELSEMISLEVIVRGIVKKYEIRTQGGFDVGFVAVEAQDGGYEITFWNEYMTLEYEGERLATFPDLIVTLDSKTGRVLTSAELKEKDEIIVVKVDRGKLKLGQGMFDKKLFQKVEEVLEKEIIKYAF